MNEELQQKLLSELVVKAREELSSVVGGIMSDFYCYYLPYVLHDTQMNASIQAEDIVKAIASGNFERDGDYIRVKHPRGDYSAFIRIVMSDYKYDSLRDNLIKSLPECPKDAKIRALEKQIEEERELYYSSV